MTYFNNTRLYIVCVRAEGDGRQRFHLGRPARSETKNEVHGEEEADIPLDMRWAKTNETGSRVEFQGEAEVDETRL